MARLRNGDIRYLRGIPWGIGSALYLLCAFADAQPQQSAAISERFWNSPGPAQDAPDAPKLLIVYPLDQVLLPFTQEETRYAGRVEPIDATVLLNDRPVKIWPGGVFTGLLIGSDLPVGKNDFTFKADRKGKATTVHRMIIRSEREKGPDAWPLAFHPTRPVIPSGSQEYWLREGSKLSVKLLASYGHRAWVRVGEKGVWMPLELSGGSYVDGGIYTGDIVCRRSMSESPAPVQFSLVGQENPSAREQRIVMTSELKIGRLTPVTSLVAFVNQNEATFLKREEGWDRWGNWSRGTPFPFLEKRGERISVDFVGGETGFVETGAVKIDRNPRKFIPAKLGKPKVKFTGEGEINRVELDWKCDAPPAVTFSSESNGSEENLSVNILGAKSAAAGRFNDRKSKFIRGIEIFDGKPDTPPKIRVSVEGRELWGYALRRVNQSVVRLSVRVRPSPVQIQKDKPLGGLKIMVDAGHGGSDLGAWGPSGLVESDVNLIAAQRLGEKLKSLGAAVRQIRNDDRKIELDERVDAALEFDPDLFISVHHNSVSLETDPLADHGPKVYYHYPFAIPIASVIAEELTALLAPGQKPRVLKENFRVNRNISLCPSVLIEGSFVCNPNDEIKLRDDVTLTAMADAIARGVVRVMSRP